MGLQNILGQQQAYSQGRGVPSPNLRGGGGGRSDPALGDGFYSGAPWQRGRAPRPGEMPTGGQGQAPYEAGGGNSPQMVRGIDQMPGRGGMMAGGGPGFLGPPVRIPVGGGATPPPGSVGNTVPPGTGGIKPIKDPMVPPGTGGIKPSREPLPTDAETSIQPAQTGTMQGGSVSQPLVPRRRQPYMSNPYTKPGMY